MSSLPTPPRLGLRVPLPPPPRDGGTAEAEREGLVSGDVLEGRYQIEERIGEGGVGVVYRALQLKLHRRVAVKLLQRDMVGDEELRPRFEREAITLAALSHPNIVSIQDYGMLKGQPFLVMELLEGRTLREVLDVEGALTPLRALTLTRHLLQALMYAHELGIVHRDLKPANLLVQALPAHEHLKVLDFGLVKLLPGSYLDRGVQLSRVGFTFGTPPYMSPEHATGGQVDARSDLYSVGILLFEMLTGQKPFDGELHEVIRHHLSTPVPKLAERRQELAGRDDLQVIVEHCLAKMRDQRYANAAELIAAVDAAIAHTAVLAARPATPEPAGTEHTSAGEAPLELKHELTALGVAYKRLWLALVAWARTVVWPWLEQRSTGLRSSLEELGTRTESRARESWAVAKPRIQEAKQQLVRAVDEAKQRLSKVPPPAADASAQPAAPDVAIYGSASESPGMAEAATLELAAHEGAQKPRGPDATEEN
jgi:hypothetical protein